MNNVTAYIAIRFWNELDGFTIAAIVTQTAMNVGS